MRGKAERQPAGYKGRRDARGWRGRGRKSFFTKKNNKRKCKRKKKKIVESRSRQRRRGGQRRREVGKVFGMVCQKGKRCLSTGGEAKKKETDGKPETKGREGENSDKKKHQKKKNLLKGTSTEGGEERKEREGKRGRSHR